jgi:hypothetical protein
VAPEPEEPNPLEDRHLIVKVDDNGAIGVDDVGFASWELIGIGRYLEMLGESLIEEGLEDADDDGLED